METIALLLDGFVIAFQPINLIVIIAGVIVGSVSYTHLTLPTKRIV